MKKIYAFCAAALMSASMFAAVPTEADLAGAYDLQNNVVLCVQFIDEATVCRDIRFVGSSNNWGKGDGTTEAFANCEKFAPVAGFDGWYAAELVYSDGFYGKPIQETEDGAWSWDWQPGKPDAWVHVGGKEATLKEENGTETSAGYGSAGAYIYQIKYWKNHKSPCVAVVKHQYSITLYAPDACPDMKPAIAGDDMGWSSNEMNVGLDEDLNTIYTYNFEGQEGHGFKFKELTDTDWSNQLQYYIDSTDTWSNFDNFELTADSVIVLDFSDNSKYRFALCDGEEAVNTVMWVKLPAENCPEAVEVIGTFDAWAGTALAFNSSTGYFTAEFDAKSSQYFKFRSAGSWDQELEVYTENDEWVKIGDNQYVFSQLWQDGTCEGGPCKLIELDLSDPEKYRWTGAQGIENVVLTEKAQKVVVDGVLYIVRDNKMFNVQGTQVR